MFEWKLEVGNIELIELLFIMIVSILIFISFVDMSKNGSQQTIIVLDRDNTLVAQ